MINLEKNGSNNFIFAITGRIVKFFPEVQTVSRNGMKRRKRMMHVRFANSRNAHFELREPEIDTLESKGIKQHDVVDIRFHLEGAVKRDKIYNNLIVDSIALKKEDQMLNGAF